MKVGVIYHTVEGHTAELAARIAKVAEAREHAAEVYDIDRAPECLLGYGAVFVGGPVHVGHYDRKLEKYIRAHANDLTTMPAAFFATGMRPATGEEGRHEAERVTADFLANAGWKPMHVGIFAGALLFTHYGFLKKRMMRKIARDAGLGDDLHRDYDLTDWDAVDAFAAGVLEVAEGREANTPTFA